MIAFLKSILLPVQDPWAPIPTYCDLHRLAALRARKAKLEADLANLERESQALILGEARNANKAREKAVQFGLKHSSQMKEADA